MEVQWARYSCCGSITLQNKAAWERSHMQTDHSCTRLIVLTSAREVVVEG